MDSPANHRSPWAKLCHYRFSISFRRFFPLSFSFSSLFSSLRPPSLLRDSKYTVPSYFPSSSSSSSSRTFFYPFLLLSSSLCLSPCQSVSIGSPDSRAISRKVLPEVRRFYYRFASLTRRPIFTKKRTILQQDRHFDDATIQPSCNIHIFR